MHSLGFSKTGESGVVLVLFAVISVFAATTIAMVVDHSRESLAITELQRAADAAALSATKRLNGRIDGWQNAKKAAIVALKHNSTLGVSPDKLGSLKLTTGPARYDAINTFHPGSSGTIDALEVTVQRGVFWHEESSEAPINNNGEPEKSYRFISLEQQPSGSYPFPRDVEPYLLSNAVKVTVKLSTLPTTVGKILGLFSFNNIEREAIAITHEELELPVAPFAVPLCALRLNNDPYAQPSEQALPHVDLSVSCTRQGLSTEQDPKRDLSEVSDGLFSRPITNYILKRQEGLARFESYIRPIYSSFDPARGEDSCFGGQYKGFAHNCKDIPLWGVLGVPSFESAQSADARQVAEAFTQGAIASPGMYFAPLADIRGFQTDASLSRQIAGAINDSSSYGEHVESTTFSEAFTEALGDGSQTRVAKRNFPFIRNQRPSCGNVGPDDNEFDPERRPCMENDPSTLLLNEANPFYDLRLVWPTPYQNLGEPIDGRILMDRMNETISRQPMDYSNPLCHSPEIPIDSLNSSDPNRHRVRKMLAPVIVPGTDERPNGKPVMYCNYREVFEGYQSQAPASTVPPVPESMPIIVGFVPVYVYDFNLADLDIIQAFQPPPGFTAPPLPPQTVLNDPVYGDLYGISSISAPPNAWQRVSSPFYIDPVTGKQLFDRNPGELEPDNVFMQNAMNNANQYSEENSAWQQCVEQEKSNCENSKASPPGGSMLGIPSELAQCFDFTMILNNPTYGNIIEAIANQQTSTCTSGQGNETISYPCISEATKQTTEALFAILYQSLSEPVPALPFAHCLPRENLDDEYDTKNKNDPYYYITPLDTTRAGYGCGGVLFKTSCGPDNNVNNNTVFLPGGVDWDDASPALVAEDN